MASITQITQVDIQWGKLNPVTNPLVSYHQLVSHALYTDLEGDRPARDLCGRAGILVFSIIAYPLFSVVALVGKAIEYVFKIDFSYENKLWAARDYARNGNIGGVQTLLVNTNFTCTRLCELLSMAADRNHNDIAEIILDRILISELDIWNAGELQLAANGIFMNGNHLIYQKIMEKTGRDPVLLSQEPPKESSQVLLTLQSQLFQ